MPKVNEELPDHLVNLRGLIGLLGSKKALADKMSLSTSTISAWFSVPEIPSKHLKKLARLSKGRFEASDFLPE